MVDKKNCNFCGLAIEPGTGKMYVKKDGTIYNLCSNKCKKNMIDLKRVPRRTKWTVRYADLKQASLKHEKAMAEEEEKPKAKPKSRPVKKKIAPKKEEPTPEEPAEEPSGGEEPTGEAKE